MSLLEVPCVKTSGRPNLFRAILGITGALIMCFDIWRFKQANNSETGFGGHHCDFEQHVRTTVMSLLEAPYLIEAPTPIVTTWYYHVLLKCLREVTTITLTNADLHMVSIVPLWTTAMGTGIETDPFLFQAIATTLHKPSEVRLHSSCSFSHYNDVIMGAIACKINSFTIVYLTVHSDADQRKHLRHWPLCGEFTGDRWIPRTNGQ